MIDKMARAMILAVSPDRDFTTNPYYEVERNYWEYVIRAGLTAMLEPTEAMVKAGERKGGHAWDYTGRTMVVSPSLGFPVMIQAALDEPTTRPS